ncbi:phospholipase A and acyltransferase 3-like [Electrophorus electricus]|uniref:phospholipase A and acyltransferase 3-like n=1 Tax=Electrophorus electricus TaxID=8005 RepID=UPI0015D0B424|nr:phospholipase A and acyltransferase 3-like [Electrophorus electricus]
MEKKTNKSEPEKGDMVAFPRGPSGVVFKHYGIADGAGNVIHFAPDQGFSEGTYKKESIKDVATHDYYVDNSQDNKKNPLPPERILKDAEAKIGTQAHYDLSNFNCEIAASELRYGKGHGSSTQVEQSMLGKDKYDHMYDLQDQFGTGTGIQRFT